MTLSRQHVARSPRGRCQNDALAASAPKRVSLKCTSSRNELRFQRVRVVFRLFCWHSGSTPRLTPRPRHPLCFHPSPHPDPSRSQTPAPTRPSVWFRACRQEGNTATPVVCSAPPLPRESGAPSPHPQPHSPPLAASPPPQVDLAQCWSVSKESQPQAEEDGESRMRRGFISAPCAPRPLRVR